MPCMLRRSIITIGSCFVAMLCLAGGSFFAQEDDVNLPDDWMFSGDEFTAMLGELMRVHTPNGIEELEALDIDGTKQWISIRGLDRDNPVLLMIHGGPGVPMMPYSWSFQKLWEDFFTVVQWDQRGSGKNAEGTDLEALAKTMSMNRIVADAEEVVAHLRERLGKKKIFVMGYSWGAGVGARLAAQKPEWLYAYVGVGQSGSPDAERVIYETVLEIARREGNEQALRELDEIAPYPEPGNVTPFKKAIAVRKWSREFNGGWYGKPDFQLLYDLPRFAPEYSRQDVRNMYTSWANEALEGDKDRRNLTEETLVIETPVIMIMGRHDLHTPHATAKAYFDLIEAPSKKFITFEHSAHMPMWEQPGLFLKTLLDDVLPLADPR